MDLGVEDDHADYGNDMNMLQERFKKELEKIPFEFKTKLLDMPNDSEVKDLELDEQSLKQLESTMDTMGKDIDQIFDVLNDQQMINPGNKAVVIEHKWNVQAQQFV